MQIIIPMAGTGERFKNKNYSLPKYFLPLQGKTVIEKIITNFDTKNDHFIFVVNRIDYEEQKLDVFFKGLGIHYQLFVIEKHTLGPVITLSKIFESINPDMPTMINYCDFFWKWDYEDFKEKVQTYDGAVICYTGFHPHLLGSDLYAGVLCDTDKRITHIQEKHSFTPNPMESLHSSGSYYFKTGRICIEYANRLFEAKKTCNGEYYVSMVSAEMLHDGCSLLCYEIHYFLQLGTPEQYEAYRYWEQLFLP